MTSSLWAPRLLEEPGLLPQLQQVSDRFWNSRCQNASWLVTLCLNFNLCCFRSSSSRQASWRVQSFPGPSLRGGTTAGWFWLRQRRRPPADEAHLWRSAHLHTCTSLSWGQRWSRPQRLVKAVIGGGGQQRVPHRCLNSSNMSSTLQRQRQDTTNLSSSATYYCSFSFPARIKNLRVHNILILPSLEGFEASVSLFKILFYSQTQFYATTQVSLLHMVENVSLLDVSVASWPINREIIKEVTPKDAGCASSFVRVPQQRNSLLVISRFPFFVFSF